MPFLRKNIIEFVCIFAVMSADFARLLNRGKQKCYYWHKDLVCGKAVTLKTASVRVLSVCTI